MENSYGILCHLQPSSSNYLAGILTHNCLTGTAVNQPTLGLSSGLTGQSQSHFTTDDQSVSPSWCRAPSGAHDQVKVTLRPTTSQSVRLITASSYIAWGRAPKKTSTLASAHCCLGNRPQRKPQFLRLLHASPLLRNVLPLLTLLAHSVHITIQFNI
jgi:hypothetical protein